MILTAGSGVTGMADVACPATLSSLVCMAGMGASADVAFSTSMAGSTGVTRLAGMDGTAASAGTAGVPGMDGAAALAEEADLADTDSFSPLELPSFSCRASDVQLYLIQDGKHNFCHILPVYHVIQVSA